jgi:hypothetical protein
MLLSPWDAATAVAGKSKNVNQDPISHISHWLLVQKKTWNAFNTGERRAEQHMTYDSIMTYYDNLELSFEVFLRISWASDNRRPGPIPMLRRRKPPEASAESRAKRCCGSTWQGCELLGVGIGHRKSERKKLWSMVTWHEMTWNYMKWHEMTWHAMTLTSWNMLINL